MLQRTSMYRIVKEEDENMHCPFCLSRIPEGTVCPCCGRKASDYEGASHHFPATTKLNQKYLVGRALGEGGFGITYAGLDLTLQRKVAIKEYFPTSFVKRESSLTLEVTCYTGEKQTQYEKGKNEFLQEARTLARLDNIQEIVRVLDYFPANNTAYIVMEYLEGDTLSSILKRDGRIPKADLFPKLAPLLRALDMVHHEGVIHRDISPDNIIFLKSGQIKLLDFGCARDMDSARTMTVMLKHGYAPIEQYSGHNQGPWTDIYSLSATIYRCLTGRVPARVLERSAGNSDCLIPPNDLGAQLSARQEQALLKGLAINPADRWKSIAEFYEAMYDSPLTIEVSGGTASQKEVESEITIIDTGSSATGRQERGPRTHQNAGMAKICLLLACILVIGGFALWGLFSTQSIGKNSDYQMDNKDMEGGDVQGPDNTEDNLPTLTDEPPSSDSESLADAPSNETRTEVYSIVYEADGEVFYPNLTRGQREKISQLSAEELPREAADLATIRRDQIWENLLVPLASVEYADVTLYGVVNAGWMAEVTEQGSETIKDISDMDESLMILRCGERIITQEMGWNRNTRNRENPWLAIDDFDGDGAGEIAVCTFAVSGMGAGLHQLWIYDPEDEKGYLPDFSDLDLVVEADWDSGKVTLSGGQYSATTTVDEFIKDDLEQHALTYGNIIDYSYDRIRDKSGHMVQCNTTAVWGGVGGYLCADIVAPVIYADGEYKLGEVLSIELYD